MKKLVYLLLLTTFFAYANEKPTLNVYTYDAFAASWGPAPKVKKAFEKTCNCNINFIGVSSSIATLRKIQLEGKKTKADVLLGLDTAIAQVAKDTKLFSPHDLDTSIIDLPNSYKDDTFVPFDYSYFAFVYDEEKTKKVPKSFEELASMPDDFKIVIQDPRSSTPGLGLLLWVKSVYGDKASDYWKRLAPHILTITKGWSEAYGLFLKGEANMALSYTTSSAYHMVEENKFNIKAAPFKEGHYAQIEVAAIVKSSKQKELGKKFLEFLYSKEFAQLIPTSNWAYPVIKDVKLHESFSKLHLPKEFILMDGKTVQEKRKAIINEWLEAVKK
ncbi:thiamine ABC transporter substrate binding subunit [Arcobacter peruensis]|uniref:thiamine ABC transporter substrate binding subunit n=1 Tax=Arcobacter peruensis TaxID=2320140 RepID=UPI000F0835EB|nr:thiamine ABC transporter substrate binding subunit [Arcobacter peruensis]